MKKKMYKAVSFIMAVCMVVSLFPAGILTVWAQPPICYEENCDDCWWEANMARDHDDLSEDEGLTAYMDEQMMEVMDAVGMPAMGVVGTPAASRLVFPLRIPMALPPGGGSRTGGFLCDFNAPMRTRVYAPANGLAVFEQWHQGNILWSFGNVIRFTSADGRYRVMLAHLDGFYNVSTPIPSGPGCTSRSFTNATRISERGRRQVRQGDFLGWTGTTGRSSGPHLHICVFRNGVRIPPHGGVFLPNTGQQPPTINHTVGQYRITANGGLNMREQPNGSARILTLIPRNTYVNVFQIQGNWGRINRRIGQADRYGWIYLTYTTRVRNLPQETVVFVANGGTGTMANQVLSYRTRVNLRRNTFTKRDHTFVGWAVSPNGNPNAYDGISVFFVGLNSTTTRAYAIWRRNAPVVPPTVGVFRTTAPEGLNHRERPDSNSTRLGEIPRNTYVRVFEIRGSWGRVVFNNRDGWISLNWAERVRNLPQLTVSYHANGGTGTMANQTFRYREPLNFRQNTFRRTDHTFTGWREGSPTSNRVSQPGNHGNLWTGTSNATLRLYAGWQRDVPATIPVTGVQIWHVATDVQGLPIGYSFQLGANVLPSNATNRNVTWRSSAPNIISISSDGYVRTLRAGTARLTVTTVDGGFSTHVEFRVRADDNFDPLPPLPPQPPLPPIEPVVGGNDQPLGIPAITLSSNRTTGTQMDTFDFSVSTRLNVIATSVELTFDGNPTVFAMNNADRWNWYLNGNRLNVGYRTITVRAILGNGNVLTETMEVRVFPWTTIHTPRTPTQIINR